MSTKPPGIYQPAPTATKPALDWTWPDFEPGEFPIETLPIVAKDAANAVAETFRLPIELAGMTALATLAGACGKSWQLEGAVDGRANFANLYVVVGARRGVGKGSVSQLVAPLINASANLEREWENNQLPTLKARQAILKRRIDTTLKSAAKPISAEQREYEDEIVKFQQEYDQIQREIDSPPSLWVGNVTSEKLGALLSSSSDESLLVYSPEAGEVLRVFFGKYRSDGKGDIDLLLSGYSCEAVKVDRIGRPPVSLEAPCITTLLMVQPSLVTELYSNEEARERGLLARFLGFNALCDMMEDDGISRKLSQSAMEAWGTQITNMLEFRRKHITPKKVQVPEDAASILRKYHNESIKLCKGPLSALAGDLSRWRENACRIALIIHATDNPDSCNLAVETAERAVLISRWNQLSSLRLLTSGIEINARARGDKLIEWIHKAGGKLTVGALHKNHGMSQEEAASLCRTFPKNFSIEPHRDPKGGPHTKLVRLLS